MSPPKPYSNFAHGYSSYGHGENVLRVHRMRNVGDEQFELVPTAVFDMELIKPRLVLWQNGGQNVRLLVTGWDDVAQSDAIIEFNYSDGSLTRGSERNGLSITKWCADGDAVVIFDLKLHQIQHYKYSLA